MAGISNTEMLSAKHWLSDESSSQHHATEFAVLPSEVEQLPDLVGYLKLASSPRWLKAQIQRPSI
jgi:hypothetical protein